jgi:hypothetical protein
MGILEAEHDRLCGNGTATVVVIVNALTGVLVPMQLIYRGVSFYGLVAGIPSVKTGDTGTFLGKTYPMKHAQLNFQQPTAELIYRGVRYTR